MKSVIGNNIIFSLFGESHSELMGITIHNLPSGLKIDEERIIIPLSKITFGFGVGGSEFSTKNEKIISNNLIENDSNYPFGGGTIGGVNIIPIAFLMIEKDNSKIIRVENDDTLFNKLLELFLKFMAKKNKD